MGPWRTSRCPPGYPVEWEADVVLRDGTVAARPADPPGRRRRHPPLPRRPVRRVDLPALLRAAAPAERRRRAAVHARRLRRPGRPRRDHARARSSASDATTGSTRRSAEVAFNISDHYQGKGIGSVLLEHLAAIAQEFGIARFMAEVLPQNRKMLSVFSDAGYDVKRHIEDGVVEVGFDIEPTDSSQGRGDVARAPRRGAAACARSCTRARSRSSAPSRRRSSIGSQLLDRLVEAGFTGAIHPVNPNVRTLRRRTAYPSVTDGAGAGRPRRRRRAGARRARGRRRVRRGRGQGPARPVRRVSPRRAATGSGLQAELLRRARGAGMRVVGPNSLRADQQRPGGAAQRLARAAPCRRTGGVGLFAQSGALGIAVLASAARRNLGISTFGSAGNRVDVSGNDFMQYWIDDDTTDAVGLYLESMGNPRKFSRIARNLALIKPVIVVKSGVSAFGVPPGPPRAPHQGPPRGVRRRCSSRPASSGSRTCTSSSTSPSSSPTSRCPRATGSPSSATPTALGTLTADACTSWGLTVSHGPVALPTEATAAQFRTALAAAFADPKVDSVLACFIPPLVTNDEDVARRSARRRCDGSEKPCAATFLGMRGVDDGHASVTGTGGSTRAIPVYAMPEDAVRALAAATRYGQWRAKDHGTPVAPAGHQPPHRRGRRAHGALASTRRAAGSRTTRPRALLQAYGIDVWGNERGALGRRGGGRRRAGRATRSCSSRPPRCCATRAGVGGVRVDLRTEAVAAGRVGVADRAARAARRRPLRRAEDGHARCAVRHHAPTRTRCSAR